jgi:hypothetical protein
MHWRGTSTLRCGAPSPPWVRAATRILSATRVFPVIRGPCLVGTACPTTPSATAHRGLVIALDHRWLFWIPVGIVVATLIAVRYVRESPGADRGAGQLARCRAAVGPGVCTKPGRKDRIEYMPAPKSSAAVLVVRTAGSRITRRSIRGCALVGRIRPWRERHRRRTAHAADAGRHVPVRRPQRPN